MNSKMFEELMALRLKRPLTEGEQARLDGWLSTHSADRARWKENDALGKALRTLPPPPVASNFMARVWQGIEASERRGAQIPTGWRAWLGWPSLAQQFAVAVVLLAAVMIVQGRRARSPAQVARSIEQVATFAHLPNVALLKDFEAISRLNQSSADLELLTAFERDR